MSDKFAPMSRRRLLSMIGTAVGSAAMYQATAAWAWVPVEPADYPALIAVGLLAQGGQYCFLIAYQLAPAGFLAPLGYFAIVLSTAAGYVWFGEVPGPATLAGIAVIVAAVQLDRVLERRSPRLPPPGGRENPL